MGCVLVRLTPDDLTALEEMLLASGAGQEVDIVWASEKAQGLGLFVRSLVGLDRQAATEAFGHFLDGSKFTVDQIRFVNLIVDELTQNGVMERRRRKTTEIRVDDSSRKKIKKGSLIRFRCQGDEVLTRVTRIARYPGFEEMFDHESVASVNPLATRDEQLANIRQSIPPSAKPLASSPSASNSPTHPDRHDDSIPAHDFSVAHPRTGIDTRLLRRENARQVKRQVGSAPRSSRRPGGAPGCGRYPEGHLWGSSGSGDRAGWAMRWLGCSGGSAG